MVSKSSTLSGSTLNAYGKPTIAIQASAVVPKGLATVRTDVLSQKLIFRPLHFRVTRRRQSQRLGHIFGLGAQDLFLTRTVSIDRDPFASKLVSEQVSSLHILNRSI